MNLGAYRYTLSRKLYGKTRERGTVLFVMLNPSTADEIKDDATIRRCIGFATAWGFSALSVGNLFALRATNPRDLLSSPDPVGGENDEWLRHLANAADLAVAAWGAEPLAHSRATQVLNILHDVPRHRDQGIFCLGRTKTSAAPRHPLYVRADKPLEKFA